MSNLKKQTFSDMFLIEFSTQSIMRSKSLIKANINNAKKSWGTLQAKLYVLKRLAEVQLGQKCA